MLIKTLFLALVLSISVFASGELTYKSEQKEFFKGLFSKKTARVSENIVFNLDLMSAYQLVSKEEYDKTFSDSLHHKTPDKVLFTFSYNF